MKAATLLAQALGTIDRETRAVVPPIHPSTTFERSADYRDERDYTRDKSPAYPPVERLLTLLEEGSSSLLFASGNAAGEAVLQSLKMGDHFIAPRAMYWGLRARIKRFVADRGVAVDWVDMTNLEALERALKKGRTKLVWCETPANPTWDVTDIQEVVQRAHAAHAEVLVDSTAATPILTRPLTLGADYVLHSATKYLNGHSDVVAGALVARADSERFREIANYRREAGAILGTFEAWLLLRGMRTLDLRVRQQSATALSLCQWLASHPAVDSVLYPGLPSHPQHAIAKKQMEGGFGGMCSIRMKGGKAAALKVAANAKVFVRATSLGGVESLLEHRKSVEGADSPIPDDLLRLSVGIEAEEDLRSDLEAAFV